MTDEVWTAVKQIGPLKVLDPDGKYAIFYRKCWKCDS